MLDAAEALTETQRRERLAVDQAFKDIIAMPSGQRVLFWMLEQCAIYEDAYAGENNATNYMLGRQSSGRRLIQKLDEIDPRTYPALLLAVADLKAMTIAASRSANQENDDDDEA
ncbi:MAG: hypothetical protein KYX69_19600 [Sphingomonas sp.]|uniref:hypothetical protein n=1 Tax=Sphingomonas sp. TaxID=28214 RepID=UPI0026086835|nr:hypothetical protein [Sphingomonas sp.]MDK2769909.1 hypothetical protein [Sphingomonas sp.]